MPYKFHDGVAVYHAPERKPPPAVHGGDPRPKGEGGVALNPTTQCSCGKPSCSFERMKQENRERCNLDYVPKRFRLLYNTPESARG